MGKIKEIKPCPFCGEDGFEIIKGRCVRCDFCGMCGPTSLDEEGAIYFWNILERKKSKFLIMLDLFWHVFVLLTIILLVWVDCE